MSSRALRRMQGDLGLSELSGNTGTEDDEETVDSDEVLEHGGAIFQKQVKSSKHRKKVPATDNLFELLNKTDEEAVEEENEENAEDENHLSPPKTGKPPAKLKKKKKKKTSRQESESIHKEKPLEDIEASILEVNRLLGDPDTAPAPENSGVSFSVNVKPLLHIDYRHLNAEAELKRLFGSEVVRNENSNRQRRQRNQRTQRTSRLVQFRDNWHASRGSGLSMKYLDQTQEFAFEHSPTYQKLQHRFADAVDSGHPENIINILRENPYHIDSLVQMADLHRINEDFQTAAESIEKALYGLECAFHPLFNLASGNCYLNYRRVENRALFLCLFKHILNLGRRGCHRTAFEFCKLLLSLDPADDPMDCMSMIDYYALRGEQYDHLVQMEQEVLTEAARKQVPNFAFSVPLAYFKLAQRETGGQDTARADLMLQDALVFFPMMLLPLLDECSVQPDQRVGKHPFFSTAELNDSTSELRRLVTLYVKRCVSCWKDPEVIAWLEKNVLKVLDIVDGGADVRVQNYAKLRQQRFRRPPLSLLRHYFLAEIPGVGLPRQYAVTPVVNHDPFPPSDGIVSYTRPARATVASQDQSGFWLSLLQSLVPSYNPYEPADQAGRNRQHAIVEAADDEPDGARGPGIPQQIQQSVNAVMEAMRQLLVDPFAGRPAPAREPEEEQGEEGDNAGWEDEAEQ